MAGVYRKKPKELEPCALDTFVSGTIKAVPVINEYLEEFVVEEIVTGEKIIFEIHDTFSLIIAKSIYKENLFQGSWDALETDKWTLKQFDGTEIGVIGDDDTLEDTINSVKMKIDKTNYDSEGQTSDYHTIMHVDCESQESEQIGYITWNGTELAVGVAEQFLDNRTKAVIIMKAFHLVVTIYGNCALPSVDKSPTASVRPSGGGPLRALDLVHDIKVVSIGRTDDCVAHYDVFRSTSDKASDKLLVLEFYYITKELICKDPHGIIIFYAYGIMDPTSVLIANLHGKQSLGYVRENKFYYDSNRSQLMTSEADTDPTAFPLNIMPPANSAIPYKVASVSNVVARDRYYLQLQLTMDSTNKALIIAQTFKIAFNFYEFNIPPQQNLRHRCYAPYNHEDPLSPASLQAVDCLSDVTIRRLGQNSDLGITYLEVHDTNNGDRVSLIFEAIQKLGAIEATAKDVKGAVQFTVYGLWSREKDVSLYLNSGQHLGLCRGDYLFNQLCRRLAHIFKLPDADYEREPDDEDPPPMIYKFMDHRPGHPKVILAEIKEGESEVVVKFNDGNATINAEFKALMLCYAVRLFYHFRLHLYQMTDMEYKYLE